MVDVENTPLEEKKYSLLFSIRRSVRYHNRRRRFFDNFQNITTALSLLSGSAAIANAISATEQKVIAIALPAIITILNTIALVVKYTEKSRLHSELAKRFLQLEQEMILKMPPTFQDIQDWSAKRLQIETEEPPIKRVLDSICHNEQLKAEDFPENDFVQINWVQRFFAPFFDFFPHHIKKQENLPESNITQKELV